MAVAADAVARRVLLKLAQSGPASASSFRLKPESVAELTAAELVVARPGKRGSMTLEITIAGRQRVEEWAHEAPPAAVKPARAPRAASDDRLARIEGLLEQILARLGERPVASPAPIERQIERQMERPIGEVKSLLLHKIAELDSERRYGGLVPIPEIRRAVQAHDIADAQVNEALESLEQDYAIDLNIAQQPTAVPTADRLAGIERPGRGLLLYVARRAP